jgi:hypothetical protein
MQGFKKKNWLANLNAEFNYNSNQLSATLRYGFFVFHRGLSSELCNRLTNKRLYECFKLYPHILFFNLLRLPFYSQTFKPSSINIECANEHLHPRVFLRNLINHQQVFQPVHVLQHVHALIVSHKVKLVHPNLTHLS